MRSVKRRRFIVLFTQNRISYLRKCPYDHTNSDKHFSEFLPTRLRQKSTTIDIEQNYAVVSIIWNSQYFASWLEKAYSGPQNWWFWRVSTPKWGAISTKPPCLEIIVSKLSRQLRYVNASFWKKISVIHNALCRVFVANAKTELESYCTDV